MRFPRPFERSYGLTLAIAVVAIAPFIFLTTAFHLYERQLLADLHTDQTALSIISGLAVAGYCFGALLAGDLIQRFRQRRLFMLSEWLFMIGCAVGASARGVVQYGSGKVLLALATGLLLVVALPPVVRRFPAARMPVTASLVNVGFFGAVTAGPLVGGLVAHTESWRWFFAALGLVGLLTWIAALFTLPDQEPPHPEKRVDVAAIALALPATVLPFWASGELAGGGFASALFVAPFVIGLACFVALLVNQYQQESPLAPVKPMWKAIPLAGVLVAMFGGAALVTLTTLLEEFQMSVVHAMPLATGLLFWPEVVGALVAAALLGVLTRSRFLVLLPLAGMLLLIAAGALLLALNPSTPRGRLLTITGLLGLGAGATVAPALWLASFCLPSRLVGPTFALVELVRSEADFIVAPVILEVAMEISGRRGLSTTGVHGAVVVTLAVTVATTLAATAIYLSGGRSPEAPDLEAWLADRPDAPAAIESPPVAPASGP